MSDFFDVPAPPPPEPPDPPDHRMPDYVAPPENELGVMATVPVELVKSERTAISVAGFTVFSTGLWFTLTARHRERIRQEATRLPIHPLARAGGLRFGIQFADGTKAIAARQLRPGDIASPPQLSTRGIQGLGGRGLDVGLWLWPLPPPGQLAFLVDWLELCIPLTRREIDARPILDAAARVEVLWPDERPLPTGAWTHVAS